MADAPSRGAVQRLLLLVKSRSSGWRVCGKQLDARASFQYVSAAAGSFQGGRLPHVGVHRIENIQSTPSYRGHTTVAITGTTRTSRG